jgi:hypothetical protein
MIQLCSLARLRYKMSELLALLIEISSLTDNLNAEWTDEIKVGACKLMKHLLSRNCPLHSFVVHDSRREDCVTISLHMARLASKENPNLELTRTLCEKIQMLTSKLICMAMHADSRAAICHSVDPSAAKESLRQQLKL